jgi:hypothetical protein
MAVESWRSTKEVADARNDERMTGLADDVKGIKSGISRLFWIIVGAIVVVLVTFTMNGGFAKAQERAEVLLDSTRPIMPASRPLICPSDRPVLVRSYCRGPSQSPWLGEAVLRTR